MLDHSRFLELYFTHENGLRSFIRALVWDRSEFEDVFQTVMLTLWKKFDTYDQSRPFGPWARGVAMKEVLQMRRESGRRPTPFSPETVQAILESFELNEAKNADSSNEQEALDKCVGVLPQRWRKLLELRYSEGLRLADLATRIGNSLAATQRDISRARQQLAECVKRRLASTTEGSV